MEMHYSVLMSVYYKEKPEYLYQSLMSMLMQTIQTNDFVLVCDGPLNDQLDETISRVQKNFPDIFHVIRLSKNSGLGNALNVGLNYCKNNLVARIDSDDIAFKNRCEEQLNIFFRNPDISICSGTVLEFVERIDNITAQRAVPEKNEDIISFSKKRNPFNHPCVMFKKDRVLQAGGYIELFLLEDYYLWVRMIRSGAKGYNIQKPLLYMRADSKMYKRRGGLKYAISQYKLFSKMHEIGFLSKVETMQSIIIRSFSSLSPCFIRELIFKRFLRSN